MASRKPKKEDTSPYYEIRTVVERVPRDRAWWEMPLMTVGTAASVFLFMLFMVPVGLATYTTVHDFYWPPPITSFHYMVFVHEDGASGDITAAGTGSVGK